MTTAEDQNEEKNTAEKQKRRLKGDGGLFYSNADKKWIGSVELPPHPVTGRRRQKRVKDADYNTAVKKLQAARKEVAAGRITAPAERGKDTVSGWLRYWIEEVHKPHVRPNTYRSYRNSIEKHIIPEIGGVRLNKLTVQHVRDMRNGIIRKNPRNLTRGAILAQVVLAAALKDAHNEGFVTENVAKKLKPLSGNPKSRGALSRDEALGFLQNCIEVEDPMTTRWAAALMTGARQGELLGLQWDRVNLARGEIDLAWQLQDLRSLHGCGDQDPKTKDWPCGKSRPGYCPNRKFDTTPDFEYEHLYGSLCLTRPKTKGSTRVVPLTTQLHEVLKAHYAMTQDQPNPYNLVWRQRNGNPIAPTRDSEAWTKALKRAGVPHRPLHAARNTTATLLLEADVDTRIIMQILGHSSIVTTHGYQHVSQELAKRSLGSLGGLLQISK